MSSTLTCIQESENYNHKKGNIDSDYQNNKKWRRRLVLKLKPRSNVTWDQNTIDNEYLGKKKSKCCCTHPNILKKKYGKEWEKYICPH